MGEIRSLNLQTEEELRQRLRDIEVSLKELQPYNGSVPGATAISKLWDEKGAVTHELKLREAGL